MEILSNGKMTVCRLNVFVEVLHWLSGDRCILHSSHQVNAGFGREITRNRENDVKKAWNEMESVYVIQILHIINIEYSNDSNKKWFLSDPYFLFIVIMYSK